MNRQDSQILLVDDNPTNLKVLSEAIRSQGWTTLIATDGESAIEQAEYARPDLILLDVMMPGIDGFETCKRLKTSAIATEIPVIFMTALSDTMDKVKGLELGAVDYITKPFQQDEVIARVKLHLKLHHLTQALAEKNILLRQEIKDKEIAEAALRQLTQELEQRVADRTAELSNSLEQLKQTQLQLIQSEKMSALGQLLAGVAHEVNNPLNFIAGNLKHTEGYVQDLLNHLQLYQQHYPTPVAEIQEDAEEIDLDFLSQDLNSILSSMKLGTDRIQNITVSLRNFSRTDTNQKAAHNVHEAIDSALLILKIRLKGNERRPAIEVIKEYGDLPAVPCFFGPLNQVVMNLLANAIDALDEANQGRSFEEIQTQPNRILIHTTQDKDQILIRIKDNGIGMSEAVRSRIFDYLFTTKPVGKGTGLGLAIAHQIIVDQHGGKLEVNSAPNQGAEFVITLPV